MSWKASAAMDDDQKLRVLLGVIHSMTAEQRASLWERLRRRHL
jgi:hypothetical protein